MNESIKTLIFVAVAAVAMGVGGTVNWYRPSVQDDESLGTGPLFADFTDPASAKAMEIIEFDQDTATVHPFKVSQVKGRWAIPSHDDYPADAARQLAEAAANMIDAKKLSVASTEESSYEEFGVIDPDPKKLSSGATGVGKRVTIQDKSNKPLADLIIGKAVEDKPGLHYVRIPGQTPVYVAAVKTDKFSTKFEDWIEKDLLKLNAFDVKQVGINDYSVDILRGAIIPRSQVSLGFDSKDSKWNLIELAEFKDGDFEPVKLSDQEELDSQKLNDMKTALDELKIVDVRRKPEGLAANLEGGEELAANQESIRSLQTRGFYLVPLEQGGSPELYSNEGEVRCGMKDGVEYVLRFGRIAAGAKAEDEKKEGEEGEPAEEATGENRYIMVTAQFSEDLLEKPELEPLPEEAEGEKAAEEKPADEKASEKKADEEKADEEKAADDKASDAKSKAERERIEKENKRKQDEYDERVKQGKDRVKELSGRFADWYYVISDATYQKIHLGREQIVKQKTPPEGEAGKEPESGNVLTDELKSLPGK